MAESNQDGRNQKLVIDYLEALLSDSDNEDNIISVEAEIAKTAPSSAVELTSVDSDNKVAESADIEEISASQASSEETLEQIDDQIVDVQEEWAEIEAAQTDEHLVDSLSSDSQDSKSLAEESLDVESLETESLKTENLETKSQDAECIENEAPQETNEIEENLKEDSQELEQPEDQLQADDETINDPEESVETAAPEAELIEADLAEELEESDLDAVVVAEEHEGEDEPSELEVTDTEEPELSDNEAEDQSTELPLVESQVVEEENDIEEQQGIAEQDVSDPEAEQNAAMIEQETQEADAQMEVVESHSEEVEAEKPVELSINCIIVLMYGLKLAIPFEQFEGHIKLSNVTLSLDNDRDWILGDFTSSTMRTHVVDTAQILFGDNYDALNSNYNEMLVLEGKHWSIVFDKVIKTQNILLSDVTENPSPQFRPWLTGTYMPEKCALVNVSAMVKMFEDELNGALS